MTRLATVMASLCAAFAVLTGDMAQGAPLLRVLYNAETRGSLYPCPS